MNTITRDYLTAEVMTATPQKLQLMLIEAALRLGQQARAHWQKKQDEAACEALVKCQQIVIQLLAGIDLDATSEPLVRRVAGLYLFIYRALITANLERNETKLNEAISVLEIERGTWTELCKQLGTKVSQPELASCTRFEA